MTKYPIQKENKAMGEFDILVLDILLDELEIR